MIAYILNFVLCSGVMWLAYRLFLSGENTYVFNRFYLLFSIVFSLAVPLITIHVSQSATPVAEQHLSLQNAPDALTPMAPAIIVPAQEKVIAVAQQPATISNRAVTNWRQILVYVYAAICLFLLARFTRNLYLFRRIVSNNTVVDLDEGKLVLLTKPVAPHSFFKYVFVNRNEYETGEIQSEIICHEQTHSRQLHSIDIVFLELVQIVFWFNPFLPLYRRSVQLNHEFLADEAVISNYDNTPAYQQLILTKIISESGWALSSEFVSYLTIRRRLLMMKKSTTRVEAWVTWLAVIPVMVLAFVLFCNKVHAESKIADHKTENTAIHFPKITYTQKQLAAMDNVHKAEVVYQDSYDAILKRNLAEQVWNKEISVKIAGKCIDDNGNTVGIIASYNKRQLLIETNNSDVTALTDALKPKDEVKLKVFGASYFYRKDRPLEITPDYIEKDGVKVFDRRDSLQKPASRKIKFPKPIVLLYDSAKSKNDPTVVTWWHIKTKVIPPAAADAPQSVLDDYKALLEKYHLPPVRKNGVLALPAEIYTPDHLKLQGLYDSMSKSQQDAQQVRFSNLILPSDKHIPTAKQLTDWQDISMYRVWLDGKKIDQAELKNYTPADFDLYYLYALSKTTNPNYKNYRYEVRLMTPTYYADYYKKTSERKIRSLYFPEAWK